MVNCCVCLGCTNTSYSGHRMHSFPDQRKSAATFRAWVRFVKMKRKNFTANSVSAHSMICEAHFTQDDYLPGDRMEMQMGFKSRNQMRLKRGVVPSVHAESSRAATPTKKRSTSSIKKRWLFSTLSEKNVTQNKEAEARSSSDPLLQTVDQVLHCNEPTSQSSGKMSDNPQSTDNGQSVINHVPSPVSKRGNLLMDTFDTSQAAKKGRFQQELYDAPTESHTPAAGPSPITDYTEPEKDSQPSAAPLFIIDYIETETVSHPSAAPVFIIDYIETETVSQTSAAHSSEPEGVSQPSAAQLPLTNPTEPEKVDEVHDIGSTCENDNCKIHFQSLMLEVRALRAENQLLKDMMSKTKLNESALRNSDKHIAMLTGLPSFSILMALFHVVSPYLEVKSPLSLFQQFLLTLIKLRMNLSFDFLAFYFGVNSATVSKVFKHCISVMYCRLVPSLVVWPEREILKKTLPNAFRNKHFEKTVCIIDCLEMLIEKQSNQFASSQCSSTSKSHRTMKYLIAISPQGSICFISNGWGGRTSDKFITENSDFLSHLQSGDLVLADRAFNVRQSVQSFQADLKIPAFTRGKKQLDPVDLESTQSSASLRTYIERVTGAVRRKYTLLQSTLPITFTDIVRENDVMHLDKIVKICCALTNVCESVVPTQ